MQFVNLFGSIALFLSVLPVGNRRFRDAITSAIDEYNNSESRLAKSRVVQHIVERIKGEGGRFLKRDRATGRWVGTLTICALGQEQQ